MRADATDAAVKQLPVAPNGPQLESNYVNQFDASNLECGQVQCAVCDNVIRGGRWYARIKCEERVVALCCPLCTEVFQGKPHVYVRRIEMLERIPTASGASLLES